MCRECLVDGKEIAELFPGIAEATQLTFSRVDEDVWGGWGRDERYDASREKFDLSKMAR